MKESLVKIRKKSDRFHVPEILSLVVFGEVKSHIRESHVLEYSGYLLRAEGFSPTTIKNCVLTRSDLGR